MSTNPRWKSGKRRIYQQRFRAAQPECAICKGRLGPIDYSTSDPKAPLGFVIDEKIPVSLWRQAGYESPSACADDPNNIQPAHRICNARKGNRTNFTFTVDQNRKKGKPIVLDGEW